MSDHHAFKDNPFDLRNEDIEKHSDESGVSAKSYEMNNEYPKNQKDPKKKRKQVQLEIEGQEDEKEVLSPKLDKKKSKAKKNDQNGTETPKFGHINLSLTKPNQGQPSEGQLGVKIDLRLTEPEAVTIHLNEHEPGGGEYNGDNIMRGLNLFTYLRSKQVPIGNKIFYILIIAILITGCAINFWDLAIYTGTPCSDLHSSFAMYFNFVMLLFIKGGVFNYFTSEVHANLEYDLKFPFIIPILATGVVANFQLPLIIYNYKTCELRSPLFRMSFGYFIINILALALVAVFFCIAISFLLLIKCKIPDLVVKMIKTIFYFVIICGMILMNALFMFITYSQIHQFSMTLLTENILYWALVVSGIVVFILRKKWSVQVFTRIPTTTSSEEHKVEGDQTPRLMVDDSKKEICAVRQFKIYSAKTVLEKIDENESENERSAGSKAKIEDNKDQQSDFVLPVGFGGLEFKRPAVPGFRGD